MGFHLYFLSNSFIKSSIPIGINKQIINLTEKHSRNKPNVFSYFSFNSIVKSIFSVFRTAFLQVIIRTKKKKSIITTISKKFTFTSISIIVPLTIFEIYGLTIYTHNSSEKNTPNAIGISPLKNYS